MKVKMFSGAVVLAALVASAVAWAGVLNADPTKSSCCAAGADCCYLDSPCCNDCCKSNAPCCAPKSSCCNASMSKPQATCCSSGAEGCSTSQACCAAVSAEVVGATAAKITLTVEGMSCQGCASKVNKEVSTVLGVETAKADAAKGEVAVTPKKDAKVSPKALWEAVEKAGYKPKKIETPTGSFTEKPKD